MRAWPREAVGLSGIMTILATIFTGALGSVGTSGAQSFVTEGEWLNVHAGGGAVQPTARRATGYAYDSLRRRLLVFGGFPTYLNDVWALDLAGGTWQPISAMGTPPSPRYGSTAVYDVANDRLVIYGGFDGIAEREDCWALSLSAPPTWTRLLPSGTSPPGRSFHVACYDAPRQRMVISGGWSGVVFLNDSWSLSLSGSPAWSAMEPSGLLPPTRDLAGAAYDAARQRMVLFGGWNGAYLDDTWSLSLAGDPTWEPIATSHRPPARREISIAYDAAGDRMLMFGGNDGSPRYDAWALPLAGTPDWQLVAAVGAFPAPRYGHASMFDPVAGRFVVFGGAVRIDDDPNDEHANDAWELAADGGTWSRIPTSFFATRNYSAVLDPIAREMLVFGGENANGLSSDLVAYSLSPNSMSRRLVTGATPSPTARYAQRAVWDPVRDRMLMFGGYDATGSYLNEVWEYRPRPTPMWIRVATSGTPPQGRFAGGLLFDSPRDRLLAFGGYSSDGAVSYAWNDLWALPLSGPEALTWRALSPNGTPPAARWGFSMVMDVPRDRAVVWGGATAGYQMLQDGFKLDLSTTTPTWAPMSASGDVPSGRTIYASVVEPAGERLVIFGGFDGLSFLNDVHALALDGPPTWTTLHPSGEPPDPRDATTAIYDAFTPRMVVYGGWGGSYLDDTWALTWDAAVPVAASLIGAHAEPGLVRLEWFASGADHMIATVERGDGATLWRTLGPPERSGVDQWRYDDRDVVAGEQYRYRLRLRSGTQETVVGPTWVTVPAAFALALLGAQPNPGTEGRLEVAFTLPEQMPVRVDLVDPSGRRVATSGPARFGPGRHVVELGAGGGLAPGVYFIRMDAAGRALTRKALLLH
jgi:hypothetical protein